MRVALTALCLLAAAVALPGSARGAEPDATPTPEALLAGVDALLPGKTAHAEIQMTLDRSTSVRVARFALWLRRPDTVLVRVREPQQAARTALLRHGEASYVYSPEWGHETRVGPDGERAGSVRLLATVMERVLHDRLSERYLPASAVPATVQGEAAFTLALVRRPEVKGACARISVDIAASDRRPLESRCERDNGRVERWQFGDFEDFGGRRIPTRMEVDDPADPRTSTTLRILSLSLDTPLDAALFTLSALAAGE